MDIRDLLSADPLGDFSDSDIEWKLFVKDHRDFILEKSTKITLTKEESFLYEHRLIDFLLFQRYPASMHWIVLWINGYENDEFFSDTTSIYVPDVAHMKALREDYKTYKAGLNKIA